MAKIYLSPSNQDNNRYAAGSTNECDQCNRIADCLKAALNRNGFQTKKAPKAQAMSTSISESNSWKADLHIPIHTNGGGGRGTEIFIYDNQALNLGNLIMNELTNITLSGVNRGVKIDKNLAELNGTTAIAVYLEIDFHDSAQIAEWIIQNVQKIGEAICKGICKHYGVPYNSGYPSGGIQWIFDEKVSKWCAKRDGNWLYSWVLDTGKWYYLGEDGYMKTGWVKVKDEWYYLKTDSPDSGEVLMGWVFDKNYNGWYYLNPDRGNMLTGWLWDENYKAWYYLKPEPSGKMAANEYISEPGKMTKYWLDKNGKWVE